jgi:predicted transposase YbfD/YdcC
VIERGNDYLVCVKENQLKLYQAIEQTWQYRRAYSDYSYTQHGHGRCVHRRIQVYHPAPSLIQHWQGLRSLIVVERQGIRQGQPFTQRQFYISSLATSAHSFAQMIQGHWRIENQLHWLKDVPLHEDAAPYQSKNAAANWSVVRTFFITVARRLGFDSLSTAMRRLANQFDFVFLQLQ